MAVELAKKTGAQLHILHITTKKELELFTSSSLEGKQITAEACVHHLYLNDNHYKDKGALIKCNPSVKTEMDQQALISAVLDNQIDIIATDHAPHLWEEKQNTYFYAPSGLPLIQHSLLMLLEFYHKQIFDLALIAQKTSHAVADRFKIIDRGYIREGYWADLVIVDCKKPTTINKNDILYKCGWSPFEGETFRSSIDTTIVSGEICYKNGKICSDQVGKRIGINR
jgi:dihydroorotase